MKSAPSGGRDHTKWESVGAVFHEGIVIAGEARQGNWKLWAAKCRSLPGVVVFERPFVKKRDVVHEKSKMYLINTAGIQG
jgi:hypothetical protein